MADAVQSYQKHTRLLPPFHFFVDPGAADQRARTTMRHLWMDPTRHFAWEVIVAAALLDARRSCRAIQALTVQDRVIRLEMRLRLRGVLPPDLQPNIDALTHRQLVALRFASDAEMPELVRDVLAGKLSTAKEIKMRIKSWQADLLARRLNAGYFFSARRIFGVSNQRRSPGPAGGRSSTSMRQTAALLELDRMARADQPGGELAEPRLVADQRDAALARVLLEIGEHRRVAAAGRQRIDVDDARAADRGRRRGSPRSGGRAPAGW